MIKTAIFVDDYLLLLDFLSRVESEFPLLEYTIYGDKEFADSLEDTAEGYVETDLSSISEAEILILLAKPLKDENNIIKNFDGTVIDITGYEFGNDVEVFKIDEPVRKVLKNIAVPVADVTVTVSLPVCVYGKHGVEDLMQQTRSIFSFDEGESLVFHNRIAFNKHFNPLIAGLPVGKTVDDFAASGGDVSVRISPLSTVFEIDVFAKDAFGLKDDEGYFPTESFFTAADISERSDIAVIPRRNAFTFVGDYVRVLIEDVMKKLREVM